MICLIKPQFEAGMGGIGKKGIVKDKKTHRRVIRELIDFAYSIGFAVLNLDFSPPRGAKSSLAATAPSKAKGNIEYLLHLKKQTPPFIKEGIDLEKVIKAAHN
jgi:23S rRNA (cytidine1920-2'-O)/16S rRNA (cytidine1409-2'-O)-methyltransferase